VDQKDQLLTGLRETKYVEVAAAHGFEIRHGHASFLDADTLMIDGTPVAAVADVLATGAHPAPPADVAALSELAYLTTSMAMHLTELPESLIIIGGGYVGIEQAQLFADLGTQVTIIGRIAPTAEPELTALLRHTLAHDGITVIEEHATGVTQDHDQVHVATL